MSASDSNEVLTKQEAAGRRSAETVDKARRSREMAASEPADSDAVRAVRVWGGLTVRVWRVTGVCEDKSWEAAASMLNSLLGGRGS